MACFCVERVEVELLMFAQEKWFLMNTSAMLAVPRDMEV